MSPTTPGSASSLNRSLSRKSTIITEAAKEHKKSYLLAGLAALAFGTTNYFMSDLSIRCGQNGVYTECFGMFISWALFHIFNLLKQKLGKGKDKTFFSKAASPYFEEFFEDDQAPDEETRAQNKGNEDQINLSSLSDVEIQYETPRQNENKI